MFLGTNDFLSSGQTPTGLIPNLAGEVQTLKDAGCRVLVGTMLSRSGNDGSGVSYDADKDAYDSLILTNAKAFGADGVVDLFGCLRLRARSMWLRWILPEVEWMETLRRFR